MKIQNTYVNKSKILEVPEAEKRQFCDFDAANVFHFWSKKSDYY